MGLTESSTELAVTAIGMTTSLGLDSIDACAAARAGLGRLTEIATVNAAMDPALAPEGIDGVPLFVGHVAPVVGAGCSGLGKLLALSKPALGELLRRSGLSRQQLSRTGLCVTLSNGYFQRHFGEPEEPMGDDEPVAREDRWTNIVARFPSRLCADCDLPIPLHAQAALARGRVGLVDMLQRASSIIRSGLVERCIVGGVESCIEPEALRSYAAAGVVKTASNPAGFSPGEAAGYFLVEAPRTTNEDAVSLRIVAASASDDVPYLHAETTPQGRGLLEAVTAAVSGRGALPHVIVADLNGTEVRAADWGYAIVQLQARFGDSAYDLWIPAQSFGETGAATGALAICMAFRANERGYARASQALITLCCEEGRRGAILLESSRN